MTASRSKPLVGYSDPLTVKPGDQIAFMVSSEIGSYRAEIGRFGHSATEGALGFHVVDSPISAEYPGRYKELRSGSYAVVPDHDLLGALSSFTIQAWIYPTTPEAGQQGLVTKWVESKGVGYALSVGEDGGIELWLEAIDHNPIRCGTEKPLRAGEWYFVAAAYDHLAGAVALYQRPVRVWPQDSSSATLRTTVSEAFHGSADALECDLLIGAYWETPEVPAGFFNGKIEAPVLFNRALDDDELERLEKTGTLPDPTSGPIAAWDFSVDIPSQVIRDASPNSLDGKTINTPARGVTGRRWTGADQNWSLAPEEYAAIHFHDDDLDDAGWEADFTLTVPEDWESGVYAARVHGGDAEDFIPFFVAPDGKRTSNEIAFLASTLTYQAYANSYMFGLEKYSPKSIEEEDVYVAKHGLKGLYDTHNDGSGVYYASRRRPITMRPFYRAQNIGAYARLSADLLLVDWLEAKDFSFDTITDEDLHYQGLDLLGQYKVLITSSHPEYWTSSMMEALEEYLDEGGHVMYLGGNGLYWVTAIDPERPWIIEVRRGESGTRTWQAGPGEYYSSTTGELGGIWRFRGRPTQGILGVGFSGWGTEFAVPYHRQPDSFDPRAAFIFEGIDDNEIIGDFGTVLGGAAGYEVDRFDFELGTPPHALLLATTGARPDAFQPVAEELLDVVRSNEVPNVDKFVRTDMVYFETASNGAVFSTSSITWSGSLGHNNYDNNVSRITENVLRQFASKPRP